MKYFPTIGILLCCVIMGYFLRTSNASLVFTPGEVNLYGTDSYYHMRRIMRTLETYPRIQNFDPFMAYPYGAHCVWPPLFDFSIATTAWLAGLGPENKLAAERLACYFPVIAGVLTIIAIYFLANTLFGHVTGILSAFFIAILPGHVHSTMLGHVDHHAIEPLFTILIIFFSVRLLRSKTPIKSGIMLGLTFVLALFAWRGSIMITGLLGLYVFGVTLFTGDFQRRHRVAIANLVSFATAFVVITPYCLTTPWGKEWQITFIALSPFHVLFFLSFTFLFTFQLIVLYRRGYMMGKQLFFVYSIALPLIVSMMVTVIFPEYVKNLVSGLEFIGKVDPWLQSISEFQSLFKKEGIWDTTYPEQMLGYIVYLMPFILGWMFSRISWQSYSLLPGTGLFLLWSIIISIVCLLQKRYVHQLSVVTSIYFSFTLVTFFWNSSVQRSRFGKILIPILVITLLYPVIAFYSSIPWEYQTFRSMYTTVKPELKKMLLWIEKNTPSPYQITPRKLVYPGMPGYGILAPWSYGHWIMYIANRPAITNNFGYAQHGLKASMKFYLSDNPSEVIELLIDMNVRYIIIEMTLPYIQNYAETINVNKKLVSSDTMSINENGDIERHIVPTNKFYDLISTRLFYFNHKFLSPPDTPKNNTMFIGDHRFTIIYDSPDGQLRLYEFQ